MAQEALISVCLTLSQSQDSNPDLPSLNPTPLNLQGTNFAAAELLTLTFLNPRWKLTNYTIIRHWAAWA